MSDAALGKAFCACILFILGMVLIPFFWVLGAADGRIDYCYVEFSGVADLPIWRVYGHRPWRSDTRIGAYLEFSKAIDATTSLGCPIGVKK
jgi:hypothetical protein